MTNEFKSKLEETMPAEELLFDPTPAFGEYKKFLEHAVAHPAKMNTNLLEFLIKKFSKKGDIVLDPMAGSGSTGVVASLHGRNAICIELEKKFYDWMEKARKNVEKHPTLISKGWIINICGDARRLSDLLQKETDIIVTSPPYLNVDNVKKNSEKFWKKAKELGKRWGSEPPSGTEQKLTISKDNISNLPLGNIDVIITSPPYAHESTASKPTKLEKKGKFKMGHSKEEPYTDEDYRSWKRHEGGNIAKRKLFIRVPCSPKEAQFHDTRPERKGTIWEYTKEVEATPEVIEKIQKLKNEKKGRSETYLEAMLKVYNEMYKVLKNNGLAIIVVKPFVRNKKVVDLPYHTWLLLKKVGFKLTKIYKLRLKQKSFWRILYEKKFPEVPKIRHEYVIIVKK